MDTKRIEALVTAAKQIKAEIAKGEAWLEGQQKELRDITDRQLPAVLEEYGLAEATLADGQKIAITRVVQVHISEKNQESAYRWLADNGLGDIIRERTVVSVHPSTLKAVVRERLEQGLEVPIDLLGVFCYTTTKL